ncbi:hypothetical protein ZYGR_0S02450 [Zygosaccharomyces rouxii]|uniref:ZYRO0F07986p n=2 Tax=Zygosaccharomyces rouxii TaxID=4956 RepID=C5DXV0_ZYGRC|nr:uncharacterized protein ZYRO0F07986g [Zygosaccharomyces rouxii]KAH9199369.1 hypothetical protein LQ764DRAFT_235181 [Zygosaccharomyces rouxii]GAV50111.1 hypothetical protein ZYGR_0S02450 [Zygosaccharomyces rouxii]CAR28611.1 ZYRO0F07986p [Zygosaccharomyces rouxii]
MYRFAVRCKEDVEEFVAPTFGRISLNRETIALVTGGSKGFGWQLVQKLALKGIRVIIADLGPPSVDLNPNGNIVYYPCNVAKYEQIKELHKTIIKNHGIVTLLFNNAGITCISPLQETSDSDIHKVIDVNYIGAYMMIQTFLPGIIEIGQGYIVNVASVLGIASPASLTSYGASKGGLIAYHNSLSQRLKRIKMRPVKTLLVCPGKLRTEMFANVQTPSKLLAPDVDPAELASQIINAIDHNSTRTLNSPYYVNLVPFIKNLNWPYLRILKNLSGMDKSTAAAARD